MVKKKVALFGGDFNPINNEDVDVVKGVVSSGQVDEVWIIPTMQHQFDWELASDELRVDMIELAIKGIANVKLCREDLDFPGMLSQYDLITRLKKKFDYDFVWLAGSDFFYEYRKWYKFSEVLKMIDFIIFERKDYPVKDVEEMNVVGLLKKSKNFASSAEIRLRVLEGTSIRAFVPFPVFKFILENGMYTSVDLP